MKLVSTLALMLLSTTLFAADGTPTPPEAQSPTPATIQQGSPSPSIAADTATAPAAAQPAAKPKKKKAKKAAKKAPAKKADEDTTPSATIEAAPSTPGTAVTQ